MSKWERQAAAAAPIAAFDRAERGSLRSRTRNARNGHNFDSTDVNDTRDRKIRGKCQDAQMRVYYRIIYTYLRNLLKHGQDAAEIDGSTSEAADDPV